VRSGAHSTQSARHPSATMRRQERERLKEREASGERFSAAAAAAAWRPAIALASSVAEHDHLLAAATQRSAWASRRTTWATELRSTYAGRGNPFPLRSSSRYPHASGLLGPSHIEAPRKEEEAVSAPAEDAQESGRATRRERGGGTGCQFTGRRSEHEHSTSKRAADSKQRRVHEYRG
jgi:hypothetical protein